MSTFGNISWDNSSLMLRNDTAADLYDASKRILWSVIFHDKRSQIPS